MLYPENSHPGVLIVERPIRMAAILIELVGRKVVWHWRSAGRSDDRVGGRPESGLVAIESEKLTFGYLLSGLCFVMLRRVAGIRIELASGSRDLGLRS